MQRHPALRQLSGDHHAGLVLARKACQAAGGSPDERQQARTVLVARFRAELEPHFQLEEDGLLQAMDRAGETRLVQRTSAEHACMRELIAENRTEDPRKFADLLTAHIRFEEQELFERAQESLDPDPLARLVGT
jgi:hemerythrin-like domain-containing protein